MRSRVISWLSIYTAIVATLILGWVTMGHGTPDWWGSEPGETTYQVQDVGELAVRLGSIDVFDRRGNVLRMEDFSNGYPLWAFAASGTGATYTLTSYRALSPPYALKMVTGSDGTRSCKAMYQVIYPVEGKLGMEIAFTLHVNLEWVYLSLFPRDGTSRYEYTVRLDIQNGELEVRKADNTWEVFASGLNLKSDEWLFRQSKLVIDQENQEYARFLFDKDNWDLSAYAVYTVGDNDPPYVEASITAYGDAGANRTIYVDNVIITQNEP